MQKSRRKKDLLIGCLLFSSLLGLSFFGWYFANSPVPGQISARAFMQKVDLEVSQLRVKKFDTEGTLVHSFQSTLVQHIPDNDTHFITLPHISSRQPNKPLLEISSLTATATQNGKK